MEYLNTREHFILYFIDRNNWIFTIGINNYPIIGIIWNLLLLVIPFFLAKILYRLWKKNSFKNINEKIAAILFFMLWLLFIPNSVYVLTDVRHLLNYCPVNYYRICINNAWMIVFFFTYASIGWVTFVLLLNQMKAIFKEAYGQLIEKLFVIIIIPIISLGVLLGLVNRWNSWEVFLDPLKIINSSLYYFIDWTYFKNLLLFSIFLYILYYSGNKLFNYKLK
jgi:uncharacterized membrane protein